MQQTNNSESRKKFLRWGAAALATVTAFSLFGLSRKGKKVAAVVNSPEGKKETVKMLTQDGKLVEIDKALLSASNRKITNEELQNWIKR